MKKVLFMAAALFSAAFANAQEENNEQAAAAGLKPGAGDFTTEVGFCPFTSTSTSLENGRLNAAYYISDELAVRAGLGFGFNTQKNDNGGESHQNSFSIAPGIVYNFDGTPKFNPYVGGEIIFRTTKNKDKVESTETVSNHTVGFGVQAFTGMNYYFSQNLYVGVEFGLGFGMTKDKETKNKATSFKPYAQPAVRLGWAF